MRFAYIDSNGNEVPIPSVDALALRIELGAITESTQLYDAQADQWGPAHTHEIFHTLSRDAGEEGGFVAPPPVAPPPVGPSSTDELDTGVAEPPAVAQEQPETTPEEGPEEAADEDGEDSDADRSFGLTLAEPDRPAEEEDPRSDRAPASAANDEAGPSTLGPEDDLPYLDLGPDESAESEVAPTDLGVSDETESVEESGFDFGDMEGGLELEESFEPPRGEPMELSSKGDGAARESGEAMELEPTMEFDAEGFDAAEGESLDLEAPMSEFSPDEPPAWMEEDEAAPEDTVLDFSSATSDAGEGEVEVPLRDRRTPRNKPSPPRLPRQRNLALPIIGVVVLLAVGIGGYAAWPVVSDRLVGSGDDESAEVYLPPLSDELTTEMRAVASAALGAVFERERAEWARSSRVQEPPSEWLAGVYLANASDYPGVEDFWIGMSDFLDRVRSIDLETFDTALRSQLQARRISEPDAEAIRERADSGFVAAVPGRIDVFDRFENLIDAALQLHRFLVANQSAIEYAPATAVTTDPVLEVNPATEEIRDAMEELLDSVFEALGALEYRNQVTAQRLRDLMRSRVQESGIR